MYSKAPAVAPVDNWSGFHIGAMGDYDKENTSDVGASAGVPELLTVNDKINNLGTFRGRVGFAFNQFLFYGTLRLGRQQLSAAVLGVNFSQSQVHTGSTAGGGVEVMVAPKWSIKAEYLYRSFSGQTYFAGAIPGGVPTGTIAINSGQVGVNYHF